MKISGEKLQEIVIREYRPGDETALYRLDLQCFDPPFRFSLKAMKSFAEASGAIAILAEISGVLAGFGIVQKEQGFGYVVSLDIAPEWRRCRLATLLMSELERRILQSGGTTMVLHVFTENLGAILFYENAGYRRVGYAKGFYAPRRDAFIYRKELLGVSLSSDQ